MSAIRDLTAGVGGGVLQYTPTWEVVELGTPEMEKKKEGLAEILKTTGLQH